MSSPADAVLRASELSKYFPVRRSLGDIVAHRRRALVALDGVSFELHSDRAIGVVGESGSGKSTLAKCLVRLEEPSAGTIMFGETDVRALKGRALADARRAMQLIYQDPYSSLNPLMTVEQAIGEPAKVHGLIDSDSDRGAYVAEMLSLVGLSRDIGGRRPSQLSGGQRQRVAIARSLSAQPRLLIADEPVSALDVSIQAQILNLLSRLRSDRGLAMIFISHQLGVVAHIADEIMVMYLGRVVEVGPARAVFARPGHPYTAGLVRSQPSFERRGDRRKPALTGEIPSPLSIPTGCRFRTRCPIAREVCAEIDPPAVALGGGQAAWCHFPDEVGTTVSRVATRIAGTAGGGTADR